MRVRCFRNFAMMLGCLLGWLAAAPSVSAGVLYVYAEASPGGDGLSWQTAYNDLQVALQHARDAGGTVDEVRISVGVYTPAGPDGSPAASFAMVDGVDLRGGFVIGEGDASATRPGFRPHLAQR
jgi:hypothetical protein